MKIKLQKSVRFQEPTLLNGGQSKNDDWRELLNVGENAHTAEADNNNLVDNENDDREEWEPATAKVTVIQRDAPPEEADDIFVNEEEVVVESYLAVAKRNPNRDVGISFTRADPDSPLCIDHISTHGPFAYSDLESGMVVSAINGKYMTWSSPEEAMTALEKETTMTLTAEFAPDKYYCKEYTMILEANMEDYLGGYGVTFARKGENLPLYVQTVEENGPFADLLPGLKVIAIDDQFMAWESPEKAQEALDSIQDCIKYITVEATTENVNTTIQQVELDMNESNEFVITEVANFSKQCPCDLRQGMTVVMLNGQVCSNFSSVDELMKDAGTIWDIIAVDLNSRRVLVTQDRWAGEAMLTFCGTGALGMAAMSFNAIDMCTQNMLAQQNAIEEEPEDDVAGTRQLLLDEEETATRDAAASEDAVNERDTPESETQGHSTIDKELASAHAESMPFDEVDSDGVDNEKTRNIPQAQDKITIVSQNAKEEDRESISQQEDVSSQTAVKSEPTVVARSVALSQVAKSTDTVEAKSTDTAETKWAGTAEVLPREGVEVNQDGIILNDKPEQTIAPAAFLRSVPKSSQRGVERNQNGIILNDKPAQTVAPAAFLRSVPKSSQPAGETEKEDNVKSTKPFFSTKEKRTSFEFSLDVGKIEQAPPTMHSFQIQKISNEDLGMKLAQGQNGGVYIAEMDSHCRFRGSGVKSGMRIAKINGIDCPDSIRVTTSYINGVEGKLNLVTTFGAKPKATKRREIFFSSY
eukprot:CAMPEP_0113628438 /NCGR_PEP_ID=MMETSP0017_2-20120614/14734_1 /TAXON_ID=2856 /ORGANISM="Cylindrotheca closterium" /LENGTH=753 /DNA_ID=CAMNT_0000538741 /DNA_START=41 /DNA_END=2302 /DNA_ORIENTATION=+ /assembly_acc=CAM_ASM_000147